MNFFMGQDKDKFLLMRNIVVEILFFPVIIQAVFVIEVDFSNLACKYCGKKHVRLCNISNDYSELNLPFFNYVRLLDKYTRG